MPIEEGTLYPLLRRLEEQGLLDERMAHRGWTAPVVITP
jgi:DNA-binding PadR family transcriptional regulator